jgi:response regulator of citrate/malate metabolism
MGAKKILILDDEILCDLVARVIEAPDRIFLVAKTVSKARSILESMHVDLILLDPNIQNGFGMSLLEDLRQKSNGFINSPKTIVMTAAKTENFRNPHKRENLFILPKPFQISYLRELVENVLKQVKVK